MGRAFKNCFTTLKQSLFAYVVTLGANQQVPLGYRSTLLTYHTMGSKASGWEVSHDMRYKAPSRHFRSIGSESCELGRIDSVRLDRIYVRDKFGFCFFEISWAFYFCKILVSVSFKYPLPLFRVFNVCFPIDGSLRDVLPFNCSI